MLAGNNGKDGLEANLETGKFMNTIFSESGEEHSHGIITCSECVCVHWCVCAKAIIMFFSKTGKPLNLLLQNALG